MPAAGIKFMLAAGTLSLLIKKKTIKVGNSILCMNIEETVLLSLTKFEGIGPCIYQLIKVQKFLNLSWG